jgi:RecA-family ATPase
MIKTGLVSLSAVKGKKPECVVYPYLPAGELTLLSGNGGVGKSTWNLLLAGSVNNKVEGFELNPHYSGTNVVYISLEDSKEVIKYRFQQTGLNDKNFWVCDDVGELMKAPVAFLRGIFNEYSPSIVILDPITYLIPQGVDMYKASDVNNFLVGFRELSAEFNNSIVMVNHLTKSGGSTQASRSGGSYVFNARVRSALLAAKVDGELHIVQTKHNYTNGAASRKWRFGDNGELYYSGESDKVESELLSDEGPTSSKLSDCEADIILALEASTEGLFANSLHSRLRNYGGKTISRAKKNLQEKGRISKTLRGGSWKWFAKEVEDGQI